MSPVLGGHVHYATLRNDYQRADPLRAGLCAMITHGNIRNAPARSGSADDRLIIITQGCVMLS